MLAVAALAGAAPKINGADAEAASTLLREIFMTQPPLILLWREPSHTNCRCQYCQTNTLLRRGGHQRHALIHGPAVDQFHRLIAEKDGTMHRPARHQEAFAGTKLAVRLA